MNETEIDHFQSPDSNLKLRVNRYFKENPESFLNQEVDNDAYLTNLIKVLKLKTLVVGVGGAGNNTVSRLEEMDVEGVKTLNINTDAQDLFLSSSGDKLLIGKDRCKGMGSGNDPSIGADAAREDVGRLESALNSDIVFLTCGLGGGTGTGAAPIIAKKAKENGALVVSFCTIPFKSEGLQKRMRAKTGLSYLAKYSDTLIPLPNDNLLQVIPNIPLLTSFKVMDEVIVRSIREIVNIINNCGLINIDFADLKNIFEKTGEHPSGLIGITESLGQESDLVYKSRLALHNPILKPDPSKVENCIISVAGNHSLSLSKVNKVISTISKDLPKNSQLKFGTRLDPTLGSKIRIMVMGKGPVSPYVRAAMDSKK